MESRRIYVDKPFSHTKHSDVLKIPRYQRIGSGVGSIGNEPGMEGDVMID